MGCWRLLVPPPRTPSAGVEWLVTVSEPRFLITFLPGVAPTLEAGQSGCASPAPTQHGVGVSFLSAFLSTSQEKRTRGHLPAPFLTVQVFPLCASCQAVHLACAAGDPSPPSGISHLKGLLGAEDWSPEPSIHVHTCVTDTCNAHST